MILMPPLRMFLQGMPNDAESSNIRAFFEKASKGLDGGIGINMRVLFEWLLGLMDEDIRTYNEFINKGGGGDLRQGLQAAHRFRHTIMTATRQGHAVFDKLEVDEVSHFHDRVRARVRELRVLRQPRKRGRR